MPSNNLTLCHPLLLLPSIFPSIRVFSNESALCIRWPKCWSFSFSLSPSSEYSGLISFSMDWLDLFVVQDSQQSSQTPQFKSMKNPGVSRVALLQEALGPLCLPAGGVCGSLGFPWLMDTSPQSLPSGPRGLLLMGPFPSSARSLPISLFTRTLVQLDSGPPFSSTTSPQLHLQQPYFQTRSRSQIWSLDSDMFWGNTVPPRQARSRTSTSAKQ